MRGASRCLRLHGFGQPLRLECRAIPRPGPGQVLLKVAACAVCRTDLHVVDGELPDTLLPAIPGHEIVGRVLECGAGVDIPAGTRLGVPWLGWTCGACEHCRAGRENLCDGARFTGCQLEGGYADHVVADARFCFPLPPELTDVAAAPLLCAGLIGYRSWRFAGDARRLGLYGFGAAAHIVAQLARAHDQQVFAFVRPGDEAARAFALRMGATWAGASDVLPPQPLDAAILFAPVGALVPAALRAVRKGGTVVCGGIHMSEVPAFPYALLWGERRVQSVANLTRRDGEEFLALAARLQIRPETETFALEAADQALQRLRAGTLAGAAVLVP